MPGPTPVNRGLLDLLNQQKREAEQLKQQGQQQQRLLQEQLRYQRETLRSQQRSHREVIRHYAKQGASTTQAVQQMKNLHGLRQTHPQHYQMLRAGGAVDQWAKFTKQEQALLERLAKQGASHTATERALGQFHRQKQHRQYQQQQQHYLGARHQQESERLGLHARHGEERFGVREEEKEARQRQARALQNAKSHEQQSAQRRDHLKLAGLSLARGDSGGAGMNAMMAMGGKGAAIGMTLAALNQGLQKTAGVIETLGQSRLTGAQKGESIGKALLPGYETWVKLRDAINGVTDSMYRLHMRMREQELSAGRQYEIASQKAAATAEMGHYQNLAGAYRGAKVPDAIVGIDRSTWQGELKYREAATRLPHQAAIGRAEAEIQAAQRDYNASKGRVTGLETKRVAIQDRVDKARQAEESMKKSPLTHEYEAGLRFLRQQRRGGDKALAGFGEEVFASRESGDAGHQKVQRTAAGAVAHRAEEDALNHEKLLIEEINRQKQMGVTVAEKESALRQAHNNLLKADLDLLKQKEQRQSHGAGAIGRMRPGQQARAGAALKLLQRGTPLNRMPPSMRAALEEVAPEAMAKRYEQAGQKTDLYKQFQKADLVDQGDLGDTRKDIAQKQVQVEVNIGLDKEQLATAIASKFAEVFGKEFTKIVERIDAKYKALGEQMRTGLNLKNANQ